jgi:ornithine cyclodeaminase/alanine dehydrogenase-like protein (mu-crystallin family)
VRARASLGLEIEAAKDLRGVLAGNDVCVTCTPSRRPIAAAANVAPETFIAAVGAARPETTCSSAMASWLRAPGGAGAGARADRGIVQRGDQP